MTGPLHYDIWRNAQRKAIHDEGPTSGMSAYEFPLLLDLVFPLVPLVGRDSDLLVDACEFTKILQMPVHGLVLDDGENSVVGKGIILVFAEDIPGDVI